MATEGRHRYHPVDGLLYASMNVDSNRESLLADQPLHARDRRDVPDRRKVTRNGRRGSDPRPECLYGLLIPPRPHTSQAECLAVRSVVSAE